MLKREVSEMERASERYVEKRGKGTKKSRSKRNKYLKALT
jgi:hypothetical protein